MYLFSIPVIDSKSNVMHETFNPIPDDKILDWFKMKQIADDILKCI